MALCSECSAFKKHFADLSECIQSPTTLAGRLYSADLLSRDKRRTICSLERPGQQTTELLDAVEGQISLDPQNFYKFVDELEKDRPMQHLCDKLRSTCAQLKSTQPVSSVTIPPNTSAQQIREHDTLLPSSTSSSYSSSSYSYSSSSSSSSSHSSTAVTRNQYRMFLKDCYQQPLPDDDKLLTTASKHYIELAVISREGVTSKEVDEFTKKSLHGLTEEILRKKSPIALKDILKPGEDGKPVRCILVEGAPGIGKSTLAWEVCHKWEELDSVKQYELVVLVRLREKKAQEARCLEDLLPCGVTTNVKELVAAIGRGKGVLIVCDGFDELPDEQRQTGSVYIDLLKRMLLPEATIIVTSRPSVSASLWSLCQHNIDRHLEVIGFTKEDIKQFAESVFSGDILEGFLSYITSNPPVYSMMYIPLNAVIVALVYQDSYNTDTPFPTTMTQLFDALTRALIRRHLISTHQILCNFCMPSHLQRIEEIDQLPSQAAHQLRDLAKVAYDGLYRNRYVFTELDEDFEGLGIMKKTTSLNVCRGPECSYTFLHLTLQEYMAALHIAITQPDGSSLGSLQSTVVTRFFAGICHHTMHLSHPLYFQCMKNLSNAAFNNIPLVHCAYECPDILYSVKKSDYTYFVAPEVGFDWYVTGYCISHFDVRWMLSMTLATKEKIDLLVKGLKSAPIAKGRIYEVSASSIDLSLFQIFRDLKEFCQLQSLNLSIVSCYDEDSLTMLRHLIAPEGGLRNLSYISHVFEGETCAFISLMLDQSSLEELTIFYPTYPRFDHLPHKNTNLKKLSLSGQLIESLEPLLPNITSLTYLKIAGCSVGNIELNVLTKTVESVPTLQVLEIEYITYYSSRDGRQMHVASSLLQLIEAAGNSQLKELIIDAKCFNLLPSNFQECYKHLLKCVQKI